MLFGERAETVGDGEVRIENKIYGAEAYALPVPRLWCDVLKSHVNVQVWSCRKWTWLRGARAI